MDRPLRRRGRRPATPPPEDEEPVSQQVEEPSRHEEVEEPSRHEEVEEPMIHPGFIRHDDDDSSSSADYEDYESEEGEEDSRTWEPPEEFVESHPFVPALPGSLPVYQRGISTLPDLETWKKTVGSIVLVPVGSR